MFSNDIVLTVIASTLLILLLIAGVIITLFISNRRNARQEMKIAQLQLDYEKGLRMAHEEVMADVSRDLHDGVGQRLTIIKMQLQQKRIEHPAMATALQPVSDMMIQTIDEVRMLGRSLNSDLLEKNGLVDTIEKEVERLERLNTYIVHWEYDAEPKLDKGQKVIVFRIFQETLNNLLKHAEAKNIYISLQGKDNFKLVVKDDGKGFDANEAMRTTKSAGLKNIWKRAELAKLKCNIETAPEAIGGKGTTFTLQQML